jgi:predicted ATP-grasp superfamily ATP-dependent carboligase
MSAGPSATDSYGPVELGVGGLPVPVLVLRRSLADLQHCVLAVARTLGRLGVPVYAMRKSRTEPATRSRYITGILDLSTGGREEEWVDQLMRLDPQLSGGILLPLDDVSAVAVGEHQEVLSSRFLLPLQPQGLRRRLASKAALATVCEELGVPTPETTLIASHEEAHSFTERFGYPMVLKRAETWGGVIDPKAPSVLVVNGPSELPEAYDRMRVQSAGDVPNVLAQEYIPGDSDSVWMFNGYFDRESRCLAAFTGQKLRQCANGAGQTALGVCVDNKTVTDLAIRLLEGVRYHGIVDMGFRFDARDGVYKLLDVNPRVGSTFRLFAAPDGADVVRAMYLDLTGRPVPPAAAVPGRTWLDEPHDVAAALRLVRARELSLRGWARSVARVSESAWWAKDDPVPFLAMAASLPRPVFAHLSANQRARTAEIASSAPGE